MGVWVLSSQTKTPKIDRSNHCTRVMNGISILYPHEILDQIDLHLITKAILNNGTRMKVETLDANEPIEAVEAVVSMESPRSVTKGSNVSSSSQDVDRPPRPTEEQEDEIGAIIVGIRRLIDGNELLNSRVSHMDSRLTQTQLELEGLVTRSSNNNKHLKSLLISSQDVRRLQELIQQLSEQQEFERERSREIERSGSAAADAAAAESAAEISRLSEELDKFKHEFGSLETLVERVAAKKQELAVLEAQHANMVTRLQDRAQDLERLRQDHLELDSRIDRALFEKCKAVETNLAVSATAFASSYGPPVTKMNRITSMLRNQDSNGRRVMSLNVTDSYDYTPSNNSDDNSE